MPEYYIHWIHEYKRGEALIHHEGHTPLAYTLAEIERIKARYLAEMPEVVFELIEA